jgi:hypothetical protein
MVGIQIYEVGRTPVPYSIVLKYMVIFEEYESVRNPYALL